MIVADLLWRQEPPIHVKKAIIEWLCYQISRTSRLDELIGVQVRPRICLAKAMVQLKFGMSTVPSSLTRKKSFELRHERKVTSKLDLCPLISLSQCSDGKITWFSHLGTGALDGRLQINVEYIGIRSASGNVKSEISRAEGNRDQNRQRNVQSHFLSAQMGKPTSEHRMHTCVGRTVANQRRIHRHSTYERQWKK